MNKQTQTQAPQDSAPLDLTFYTVEALTVEDIEITAPTYDSESGDMLGEFSITPAT